MHALTILLRRVLVFMLTFGLMLPLVILVYWLSPEDWRHQYNEGIDDNE